MGRREDDREVEELVRRFRPKAKRITGFHGIPTHEADDLIQQTYLTFLCKRDEVRRPEAWLAGTLNQRCLMFWRSRRRSWLSTVEDGFLEAAGGSDVPPQEMLALRRDLTLAIAALPVRWQRLLRLKFGLGLDSRETAEILGYRYSGIYTITKRCLAALAQEMEARGWTRAQQARCPTPRNVR
jgi:RNA polymerase sigma factor (sigma-70 family)